MENTEKPLLGTGGAQNLPDSFTISAAPMVLGLHPKLADTVTKILAEAKERGLSVGLHSGLRTWEQQSRLYELGRSVKNPDGATEANPRGNIVTKTIAGYSWHNYGHAVDIVFKDSKGGWTWDKTPEQWEELGKIGEMFGVAWGGRWKMKDYPHFELICKISVAAARKVACVGGIEEVWKEV